MADVCSPLIEDFSTLGFTTEAEAIRFKNILDAYVDAVKNKPQMASLFKALGENAYVKLQTDTQTAIRASGRLNKTHAELEARLDRKVSKGTFLAALLNVDRQLSLLDVFDEGKRAISKDARRLVKEVKNLSPMYRAKFYEDALTGNGGLGTFKAQALAMYPEKVRTGLLEGSIDGSPKGNAIDRAFPILQFRLWEQMEPLLKPDDNGVYKQVDRQKLTKLVASHVESIATLSPSDKSFLINMVTSFNVQENLFALNNQALGIDVKWNKDRVMPNFHDKAGMLLRPFVERAAKYGKDANYKQVLEETKLEAKRSFVESMKATVDYEKTFGKEIIDKFSNNPSRFSEYVQRRFESTFDSMMEGELRETVPNDFLEGETLGKRIPSAALVFASRTYYFKDGDAWFRYHAHQSTRMKDLYQRDNYLESDQGSIVLDLLLNDGRAASTNLAIAELLGTSPSATVNRFHPPSAKYDLTTTDSADKTAVEKVLLASNDVSNLKQYLFPSPVNRGLDVDAQDFDAANSLLKTATNTDFEARFQGDFDLTAYEKSLSKTLLTLSGKPLSGVLYLSNSLLDPALTALKLGSSTYSTLGVLDIFTKQADLFGDSMSFLLGRLTTDDPVKQMKATFSKALGVKAKDLTKENAVDLLESLSLLREFVSYTDLVTTMNRRKHMDNPISQMFDRLLNSQSPAVRLLGGSPMSGVNLVSEMSTRLLASKMLKSLFNGESKPSNLLLGEMASYNISFDDFKMVDMLYDNVISGSENVIDTRKLLTPLDISFDQLSKYIPDLEVQFQRFYKDSYEIEFNKYNRSQEDTFDRFATLDDFITVAPDNLNAKADEWRTQFAKDYTSQKAKDLYAFWNGFVDEKRTKLNDAGFMARIQQESTVRDSLTQQGLLYLKRFMFNYVETELARNKTLWKDKPEFMKHAVDQMLVLGATGVMYQTLLGVLSNERRGALELYDVWQDEDQSGLTTEQKTAKTLGALTKLAATGFPLGGYLATTSFVMGQGGEALDLLTKLAVAPAVSNLLSRDFALATGLISKEAGRLDGETSQQEESRKNKEIKALSRIALSIPITNFALPRLLMGYTIEPYLRDLAEIATEQDKYEEDLERQRDLDAVGLFTKSATYTKAKPLVQ